MIIGILATLGTLVCWAFATAFIYGQASFGTAAFITAGVIGGLAWAKTSK